MNLLKRKAETQPVSTIPIPDQPVTPEKTEIIDAEISLKDDPVNEVNASWLGVISADEVAKMSDSEYKATEINLLFSIFNELRDLNRNIKEL